jgi:hypothetical protein
MAIAGRCVKTAVAPTGTATPRGLPPRKHGHPIGIEFTSQSFTLRLSRLDLGEVDGVFRLSAMIGGTRTSHH